MGILRKIAAKGKAFLRAVKAEYDRINSPVVRLAIIAVATVMAFWLAWKAMPLLLIVVVLLVATLAIGAGNRPEDGQ